jgi:hypothetical protein
MRGFFRWLVENRRSGAEVELGGFSEGFVAMEGDEIAGGLDDGIGGAEWQFDTAGGGCLVYPIDESLASQD